MLSYFDKHALSTGLGRVVQRYLERGFSRGADRRLLIYFHANRICFSQVYPFLFYARRFWELYRMEVRLASIDDLLDGRCGPRQDADLIILQPWFAVEPDVLARTVEALRVANPEAEISFLDAFAHGDIRLARHVEPYVSWYLKKSLFRDHDNYLRAWEGHTNLTEFYGRLYGIESGPVDWRTPRGILERLRLSPNFFTDHRFITQFTSTHSGWRARREIDIHARMATRGPKWYSAMRKDALNRVRRIRGVRLASRGMVPKRRFLSELGRAKLCLSPFGFGELCWRDVEAFLCGAALVKQDMSHVRTLPDLYEPGVTYFPVKWDFSDLESVVLDALSDESRIERVASAAYERVAGYLKEERFLADTAFLFDRAAA